MTLQEAIETSEMEQWRNYIERGNPIYEAHQLGIEALKKWKVLREGRTGIIDPLLPGETEE